MEGSPHSKKLVAFCCKFAKQNFSLEKHNKLHIYERWFVIFGLHGKLFINYVVFGLQ